MCPHCIAYECSSCPIDERTYGCSDHNIILDNEIRWKEVEIKLKSNGISELINKCKESIKQKDK